MVDDHSSGDGTNVTGTNDVHTTDSDQNLQCETLDEAWMCSSGSKNHSHCIKFCTAGLDFYDIICYIFNHFMLFLDFCLTVKSNQKMVQQSTENACASTKNARGLKKVKHVRSWTL